MGIETIRLENSDVLLASSATEIEARLLDEMNALQRRVLGGAGLG